MRKHLRKIITALICVSLITGTLPVAAFGVEKNEDTKAESTAIVSAGEAGNNAGGSVSCEEPMGSVGRDEAAGDGTEGISGDGVSENEAEEVSGNHGLSISSGSVDEQTEDYYINEFLENPAEAVKKGNIIQAASNGKVAVVLDKEGRLWVWGDYYGKNGWERSSKPKIMKERVKFFSLSIAPGQDAGQNGIYYLDFEGRLYRFNFNRTEYISSNIAIEYIALGRFGGDECVGVIDKDGNLYMKGANKYGQLGDGTKTDKYEFVKIGKDMVKVVVSHTGCAAIDKNENLWVWGNDSLTPVIISENIASVSYYSNCIVAIDKNETLWMWLGENFNNIKPVKVSENIVSAAVCGSVPFGANLCCYIDKKGRLWRYLNKPTQIGDNMASVIDGEGAIDRVGRLWMWGGDYDVYGTYPWAGPTADPKVPTLITFDDGFTEIDLTDSPINGKGTVKLKKFVWDKDGKRHPNTALSYEYGPDSNTTYRGSTTTDKEGVAVFDFNEGVFKSSADYQQNAYMYLKYNFGGKEEKLKLHIAVDPYSYTETYTGDITAKAKGGYGTGAGDEDLGASLSGKLLVGDEEQIKSDVNFSVVGSKKSLDLTNSNYSRGSIEANITPEVKGKMFNVSLGNPAADTSAYYTRSYGMQAGDLDNMSLLELDEIARFFGNTIRETKKDILLNHTILGFLNPINFYEYDTHSRGYGFDAGAGLDPFKLTVNTGDSGKAEGTILPVKEEMSFQYKEKNNKDGSKTYESSASSYAGVKMADITLSDEIGYGDEESSISFTTNSKNIELWPMGPRHDITYSADVEGGKLVSLGITSPENDPPKLFRNGFTETRELSAELFGKNAEYMTGKIGQLDNLSKGVPLPVFSEISDTVFSTLGNPMLEKKFTRSKSRSRAETLSLGFSPEIKSGSAYKPVIDLGVDYECKLTQSFDWDVVRIVDIDGLETASVEIKSVVDYPKTTLYESLVQKALSRLEQVVEEKLGFESGTLADIYTSIRSGNAILQLTRNPTPAVIDYVYYLINVLNGNENPAGAVSYAIETRTEEAAGGEPAQTVQAVTIGTPVVLKIEDAEGNDVENNPTDLKLTMTYTQEDLAAANLGFAEDNDIRIYRYVSEDCVYEPVKSTCDPGERRVVAETSKAGEYVMAVDRDAPVISGVSVYDSTETPFIGAYISDFLGISSVVLKIDGTEYLNKDTYAQYMNGTDLFWQVPEDRKLSTGEHELLITASDSTGKTSEASANFIVLPPVAATGISMNTAKLTVSVGEARALYAYVLPYNATNKKVIWSSSDPSIATVDRKGWVTGVAKGETVIVAKSVDGGFEDTCTVTVSEKASDPNPNKPDPNKPDPDPVPNPNPSPDPDKPDSDDDIPDNAPKTGIWVKGLKQEFAYTGSQIKPEIKVYDGRTRLYENKDYTLKYKNNTKPGTAYAVLTMKGNYSGSKDVPFTIRPASLITDISADAVYTAYKKNKTQKLKPVLYVGGQKLKYGKNDLSFTYPSESVSADSKPYSDAGTWKIHIAAKNTNLFTGEQDVDLVIVNKPLMSAVSIKPEKNSLPYTGSPVVPKFTVKYKNKPLTEGTDYTVMYKDDHTDIGKHMVVFKGNNKDYFGSKTVTFKISGKYDLTSAKAGIEFDKASLNPDGSVPYTFGGAKPAVIVKYDGKTLTAGKDYAVSYANHKALGTATATVKGKGSYKGSPTKTFEIKKRDINTLSLNIADVLYSSKDGAYKKTSIVFTDGDYKDQKLRKDRDYTVEYGEVSGNAPEAGSEIKITLQGKGNYSETINTSYRIIDKDFDLTKAKVTVNGGKAYAYTGKAVTPAKSELKVTIKNKGDLTDTDYDIIGCFNNVKKGNSAYIKLRGKGKYAGVKVVKFKIGAASMESEWSGVIMNLRDAFAW